MAAHRQLFCTFYTSLDLFVASGCAEPEAEGLKELGLATFTTDVQTKPENSKRIVF